MSDIEFPKINRRGLLGGVAKTAALVGGGGIAGFDLAANTTGGVSAAKAAPAISNKAEVKPGDLDEYYAFFSGGQSGEVRVLGLPSMREFARIPVFNRCSSTGWGLTNESRRVLTEGLLPATRNFLKIAAGRTTTATSIIHTCPSPTARTTAATSSSTTRRTAGWRAFAATS